MGCKGKCYLSKKLKEQEKQEQQTPVSKTEKFDVAPFFLPKPFLLENTVANLKTEFFIKNDGIISSFPVAIFHPPSFYNFL